MGNFMQKNKSLLLLIGLMPAVISCDVDYKKIEQKAALINKYESVAIKLEKENRELQAEIKRLEYEREKLKHSEGGHATAHNEHAPQHEEHKAEVHAGRSEEKKSEVHEVSAHGEHEVKREVASIPSHGQVKEEKEEKDFVEFKTYKWHAEDMEQIANKEFKEKHYEKAAQFYHSILENYPHFKGVNDEFYFKAGIASFETENHHEWTLDYFETLMTKYPTSQYFRSAKLWVALTHMKLGEKKKFFATVEEFRKKYRNTNEWKILSSYYEKIEEKTNE
jgi:tetratricopeptide (TPR) repeat protein